MVVFGICDLDYAECYALGCICRLNSAAGFQFESVMNGVKPVPFRNKCCCHFHKTVERASVFENMGGVHV